MAFDFGFGDFGYGIDEERRRAALRRAIAEAGARISAGATTEGFGSLNAGFTTGMMSYRDQLERMHLDELKAREKEEEGRYIREERAYRTEERDRLRRERAEKDEAERAEREARLKALERVDDPELRGELELRMGQDNWWSLYDRVRAEPGPSRPPETRNFADDTTRVWDAQAGEWRIVARKPAKAATDEEEKERKAEEKRREKARRQAELEARKETQRELDREIEDWHAESGVDPGKGLPRDYPQRRARILEDKRAEARFKYDVADDPLDEIDSAPPARGPASAAAAKGEPPRAKVPRAQVSAMIAEELQKIPERNREAAGRELWRAWELGVYP